MTSKWAEIINTRGSVGVLWMTDGDFGFSGNASKDNAELVLSVQQRLGILKEVQSLDNEIKYGVLFDYLNSERNCLSIVTEGDPEELHAFVAAATPKQYSSEELSSLLQPTGEYNLTYDDDKNVVGLVWDNAGEVLVRENGEWISPLEEDDRIYGGTVRYVSPEAVDLYDKLVQDNPTPKLEAFKEVSLD